MPYLPYKEEEEKSRTKQHFLGLLGWLFSLEEYLNVLCGFKSL